MDEDTKDGYLVSAGFIAVGLIFFYVSWGNFDLSFWIGIVLTGLGIAGFKWPKVAEILLHWAKKQENKGSQYSKQSQRNTKNSNQYHASHGGKIIIQK